MALKDFLARSPALEGASAEALGRIAQGATERVVERGQFLWRAGDTPVALTVVRSGLVKIVKSGQHGKKTICGLFSAPDTIGDAPVLQGTPFPADALVATPEAKRVDIPRNLLLAIAAEEPMLGLSLARSVQQKLNTLMAKIDVLSAGSVEARLATLLVQLDERFGDELDDGTTFVPVVLSRQELADLVATSFETAIRAMTKWERERVVGTTPNGFSIMNRVELRKVAGCD
jgi:CRP/FNR family transcriptional regulator